MTEVCSHAKRLWTSFQQHVSTQLSALSDEEFDAIWGSAPARTEWYAGTLMKHVAIEMNLEFCRELLLVDYALCEKAGGSVVPVVFVESENDPFTAIDEVRKLCALGAPLRVLMTVAPWESSPGVWPASAVRSAHFREIWRQACQEYAEIYGALPGIIAAIVGERRPDHSFWIHFESLAGESLGEAPASVALRGPRVPRS